MSGLVVICNDLDYFLRHRAEVPLRVKKAGHQVTIVTGGRFARASDQPDLDFEHTPIERFSFNPFLDAALTIRSLKIFFRTKPEAVHLITLKPAIYAGIAALISRALGRGPERVLITIPGLGRLMSPSSSMSGFMANFARKLIGLALRFISSQKDVHFTFETHHDFSVFVEKKLVSQTNASVIKGAGVNPALFYPKEKSEPTGALRVLFASRLLKSKGLEAFLMAAQKHAHGSSIQYVVAGMIEADDPDGYSAEELARNPAITFLGEQNDMPSLLRTVDVVCLPTLYGEGIPRILIEAAACGIASIATDVPGCNEIVLNGETGVLIKPGMLPEMANEIASATDEYAKNPSLLADHSQAALSHFRAGGFSESSVIEHFVELLGFSGRSLKI